MYSNLTTIDVHQIQYPMVCIQIRGISKLFLAIFSNFEHARQLKEKSLTNQHMHSQAWRIISN